MTIEALTPSHFPALHEAFLLAFASYQAPLQPSPDELRQRFKRIGLDYRLSAGAFDEGRLVGFILTGKGGFGGIPTAYNGGTGVIPEWRQRGLAKAMYQFLFPLYRKHGLGQCLLEVMEENEAAQQLYESLGFRRTRLLHCYAAPARLGPAAMPPPKGLHLQEASLPDWEQYEQLGDTRPSWQNGFGALARSTRHEVQVEAYYQTGLVGFASFNPNNGRLSQLAVDAPYRGMGIGAQLLRRLQELSPQRLSILNVDAQDAATCRFFEHQGFRSILRQWEMALPL